MLCTSCGFDSPEEMKFCTECASPLKNRCPNCGFENPPRAKFCGECATSLTERTPTPKTTQTDRQYDKQKDKAAQVGTPPSERRPTEAERRQITVMFSDLVGSTALSEQLDPEELRDVVRSYQETCAEAIEHYDGYIAQYLGDGLLVYFGYPLAHEDDAQRAVRAGLGIVGAIHELPLQNSRLQQPIQVRVGIHTGLVVVGEMGGGKKRDPTAIVGETPNISARLQELAQPNTVVITPATYRLIEGLFDCKSLGMHTLKGISTPIEVYQVLQESGVRSRFEVAVTKGLTPLVGREQEVGILLDRWEQAKEGRGQTVLISGEAGIGKSRLVRVLKERLVSDSYVSIENRCSPYYHNSALYPIINHLDRLLEFNREDSHQQKINKLEKILEKYEFSLDEKVPLFGSLLSLPIPDDRYTPIPLTPQRQKQKTIEALLAWLHKEADIQPVLYIMEDLHWVDPSTLEYLNLLIEQVPTARIFAIFTFRPDFKPPWAMRSHMSQIMLSRLAQKQVEAMVNKVAGGKSFPIEVVRQIIAKTDGVPLYVEELTKMVLESGLLEEKNGEYNLPGPLAPLAIPATLHDSLMARLDRITTGEICGLAATLGRSFTYELIDAVSTHDEPVLQRELNRLVEAELIYQRGLPPNSSYMFKHALIQEAAYQSLLKSKRRRHHEKIAQVLEERFQDIAKSQPEILAHHYTEAGLIEQAIEYWKKAGLKSRERSANIEAIGHLNKGLELLRVLPENNQRAHKELGLQTVIGPSWMALRGYAAPEVEQAYTRARELCDEVEETPHLFPVLWGLWLMHHVRADLKTAHELGDQLLHFAQHVQDPSFLVEAHRNLGATLFCLGELMQAQAHLEKSKALYDSKKHRLHISLFGQDPGVASLSYGSWILWLRGYPDQALERVYEALTLAQELSHPFSIAYATTWAAWLHQLRREGKAVQEQAEAAIALCSEQAFEQWGAWATSLLGWGLNELGQKEEGISQIRQGLAKSQATGAELLRPYYLSLLAEAYGNAGLATEGLTVLDEAIDTVNRNAERLHEAEIYRLKGELQLSVSESNQEEAEKSFHRAVMIAQAQGAKSLELRAVMSFTRLLQKRGKNEEARKMLAEIYGWFTEGFETKDLKDAKELLK